MDPRLRGGDEYLRQLLYLGVTGQWRLSSPVALEVVELTPENVCKKCLWRPDPCVSRLLARPWGRLVSPRMRRPNVYNLSVLVLLCTILPRNSQAR